MSPLSARRTQFKPRLDLGCWVWPYVDGRGYGYGTFNGEAWSSHRLLYSLLIADIPLGMTIDHLCRNHSCVNPWHMEVVTRAENVLRGESNGARAMRTGMCKRGHPLDQVDKRTGWRRCSMCQRLRRQSKKETIT